MSGFNGPPDFLADLIKLKSRVADMEKSKGIPKYTTATLPDPTAVEGLQVYDLTSKTMKYSNGTAWIAL